ncbi:MAG: 16S rRNA (adenine(1518)-N(6)/adenine(1519)-N(6))-dimethyltransferase RsmA [Oscillospiraceae bacterium]|nr:16S rRNA (adenine(1518)-N(6)/adenine(1519)-N(6))-dimethyltransferase RsmA [Oscillospiraceae bacterium]MDD4369328.1 16S rRNA (adenine(1518)-N(6)/adenine(1519)-N(6))-dimethyltransferase RsmA [Oscillospiraceae bacterium]
MTQQEDLKRKLEAAGLTLKYRLGQNFLADRALTRSLAGFAGVTPGDAVLEIGPGAGALSQALLDAVAPDGMVVAYEIDQELKPLLQDLAARYPAFQFELQDAVKVNFSQDFLNRIDQRPYRIAANLPYYLTSKLMEKCLCELPQAKSMAFMIQEDVLERLVDQGAKKQAGPLTALMQSYGTLHIAKHIPATAFYPRPRVNSAFIVLRAYNQANNLQPQAAALLRQEPLKWQSFLHSCYRQRRKTLVNNLKNTNLNGKYRLDADKVKTTLQNLSLREDSRAENLDPDELAQMYQRLTAAI